MNLPIQWLGPLDKNSINDQQATEMGTQFNVSYNHWGVKKISTIKKLIAFISLGNDQDKSLLSSEVLSKLVLSVGVSLLGRDVILFRGQMSVLSQISSHASSHGVTFQNTVVFLLLKEKILLENQQYFSCSTNFPNLFPKQCSQKSVIRPSTGS